MPAFYTNVTVRSSSLKEVLSYLRGRAAFVSPEWYGHITIYYKQCYEGGLSSIRNPPAHMRALARSCGIVI